ncbi:hypothetical protein P8452_29355 [Trifolium repens]|nr:hypothetical protein P8452_29355 [Trifolium repens]
MNNQWKLCSFHLQQLNIQLITMAGRVASSHDEETSEGSKKNDDILGEKLPYDGENPSAGMTFSSEDEATDYYMNYARWRPPEKRKVSKLDQIVKKKIAGKKTTKRIQNSKNDHSQEEGLCTSRVQEVASENYFRSQIIDGIGTQESIQHEQSYFQKSGIIDKLAPFNPNQEYTNEDNSDMQSGRGMQTYE